MPSKPNVKKVIVVGGGLIGFEIALYLSEQKKKVTIVEMLDQFLEEMDATGPRFAFFERLNRQNFVIKTNKKLEEITDDGIIVSDGEGKKSK